MKAGYLIEIAFNLSGRLVALETGHDSWLLTRDSFQFVVTTGGS